jgi:hypothetical protein
MLATVIASGKSVAGLPANAEPPSISKTAPTILSFRHVMGMPSMKKESKRHTTGDYV